MVKRIFVVCSQKENYFELFTKITLQCGEAIEIDQAPWIDIEVVSYTDTGGQCLVKVKPNRSPFPHTKQGEFRTFQPDFLLLRSYALGNFEHDWRRKIGGFFHADIPCVNSLDSFVYSIEKVTLYMKLRRVQKRMPDFPLVSQGYYSHPSAASFLPDIPCVIKVGSASQGVGKARVTSQEQWIDSLSLITHAVLSLHFFVLFIRHPLRAQLSMMPEWFVSEKYHPWVGDVRVQKIGKFYRAIQRSRMNEQASWKANDAISIKEEDVPVQDRWKRWIDEAASELQMEMCGMDLLIDDKGKEVVLELNSSSIGFPARHAAEDTIHVRDLVLEKMNALWPNASKAKDDPKAEVGAANAPKVSPAKDGKEEKKKKKDKKETDKKGK